MKELLFFILYLYIRLGLLASTRVSRVSPEIYMLPDKNVDFLKFYLIITGITSLTFEKIFIYFALYVVVIFTFLQWSGLGSGEVYFL